MIGKTNVGGGGSTAWAVIGVTYPSGSTCTATDGTNTLTAAGTSGLYIFSIPEPDTTPVTWTVSCTDGTRTKSEQVTLTAQYECEEIILVYARLPVGYQEVEYLRSNETQYIDLGYTEGLSMLEHSLTFMMHSGNQAALGCDHISQTAVRIGRVANGLPYGISYIYGGNFTGSHTINEKISVVVNNASSQIIEDGTVLGTSTMSGGSAHLILFGEYQSGDTVRSNNVTIYEYKQTNLATNTITYHLIPCYRTSDNVAGMYNLADNTFITNDGTGSFIVGPDVAA